MAGDGELRVISLAEVEQHNYQGDDKSCWIIIEGKVYDVTKFLSEHPGGEEVITELAGKDATIGFLDVGHSKDAVEMTNEYLIGTLPANETKAATTAKPKKEVKASGTSFADIILSPTWTNFLIPTAIGIVVYVLYKAALKVVA